MVRRVGLWLIPAAVVAAVGAAVASGFGHAATDGSGYALLGLGVVLTFTMGLAGQDSVAGSEMRMDGREPQGLRGRRWVELSWATGTRDPRSLPHHDPSIAWWLLAGFAYVGLGLTTLIVF